ncbi:MAG TPA: hypothetical protein DD856_13930 [Sulfobacillus sp.]|nr:hypothetical protein [Sulfobacillus sp.]
MENAINIIKYVIGRDRGVGIMPLKLLDGFWSYPIIAHPVWGYRIGCGKKIIFRHDRPIDITRIYLSIGLQLHIRNSIRHHYGKRLARSHARYCNDHIMMLRRWKELGNTVYPTIKLSIKVQPFLAKGAVKTPNKAFGSKGGRFPLTGIRH